MELAPKDQAAMVLETVQWITRSLIEHGVDGSKVEIQGYCDIEDYSVVLTVHEKSGAPPSRRRPVPNRQIARHAVSHEFLMGNQSSEGTQAVYALVYEVARHPHLMYPTDVEVIPEPEPPTEEDLAEVHQILAESRARRDQRLARRQGGGPGTPDRTTGTP